LLDPLIFGGGSMLRLCHDLNRYSVDLDFWFVKAIPEDVFFEKCGKAFEKYYEITDAQMKHYTILFELRSPQYPRRLKIEIRREVKDWAYQQNIAFSRFSSKQVLLKAHTLDQTMENKIKAFFNRGEIRDCFDIEFMIRRGVEMSFNDKRQLTAFQKMLSRLKDRDFRVKLGSILDDDIREYYVTNRFRYLQEKLASISL
jgi:predicted nucleotidyltransferase component of viral defense system